MPEPVSTPDARPKRRRKLTSRWSVRASDMVARSVISISGIGTIIAVSLVFVFLASVVAPLFQSAEISDIRSQQTPLSSGPLKVVIDEYRTIGWALYPDGQLQIVRLDTGETLSKQPLFEGPTPVTAAWFAIRSDQETTSSITRLALGYADGSVRLGSVSFKTTFRELVSVPKELHKLKAEEVATLDGGVVQRTQQGQFRLQVVSGEVTSPVQVADGKLQALAYHNLSSGQVGAQEHLLATYSDKGQLQFGKLIEKTSFTGDVQLESELKELPAPKTSAPIRFLSITGRGDNVLAATGAGQLARYDTHTPSQTQLAESVDLLPDSDATLTVCQLILGQETLVVGDSQGDLTAWFRVRSEQAATADGFEMVAVHPLSKLTKGTSSTVRCVRTSERGRMIVVGYEDGMLRVFQVTTEQLLGEYKVGDEPIVDALIAPKDNGLVALTPTRIWQAEFDPAYPEATFASLFLPVWYEGYSEPLSMWQSSFAGVGPEMKLGLGPLIFGTLKATFYSMLFGAPLALLAAIFTAEFLAPRVRARIKPSIETMASLPSVVLGFLAALVFAPFVEKVVPAVLATFVFVPVVYLLSAFLWNLLPNLFVLRHARWRFPIQCVLLFVGLGLAFYSGPHFERLLFSGDIMRWLDGQVGTGFAGWLILFLPLSAIAVAMLVSGVVNRVLRANAERWTRRQFAMMNLAKFAVAFIGTLALASLISGGLTALGFDPRGTFVDTYAQRNALVVGFVMGFAIVPIIYTIADDALNTVPDHLRTASLACGATRWQTTVRVVVPTAMSGLFSALMIGMGRAVGETMIMLMAGGNTPVWKMNIFEGFRTLAANIAVELPEAAKDNTHYRTLFLAALTLFVLTFFINTVAEMVRLHFRKRAYQL